jgi:hypothetical protein
MPLGKAYSWGVTNLRMNAVGDCNTDFAGAVATDCCPAMSEADNGCRAWLSGRNRVLVRNGAGIISPAMKISKVCDELRNCDGQRYFGFAAELFWRDESLR